MHYLSCRDENVKMAITTTSPTKRMMSLGVHLDKNLTFEAHVQSALGKIAEYVSEVMRFRHFRKSSKVVRYHNIYMKPVIQYGL